MFLFFFLLLFRPLFLCIWHVFSFLAALCSSLVFGTLYKRPGGPSSLWQTTPASEQSWGAAAREQQAGQHGGGFWDGRVWIGTGIWCWDFEVKGHYSFGNLESIKVLMRLSGTEIATQEAFISMHYYSANYNRLARQGGGCPGRM